MKRLGYIFLFLGVSCLLLSFLPVDRSVGEITGDIQAPQEVKKILRGACYDCHSFESKYPFYAYVFPISFLIQNHIQEGREELNFSTFETLTPSKKSSKMKSMLEDIESNEMPLFEYKLLHQEANLSEEQKHQLISWLKEGIGESEEDDNN